MKTFQDYIDRFQKDVKDQVITAHVVWEGIIHPYSNRAYPARVVATPSPEPELKVEIRSGRDLLGNASWRGFAEDDHDYKRYLGAVFSAMLKDELPNWFKDYRSAQNESAKQCEVEMTLQSNRYSD